MLRAIPLGGLGRIGGNMMVYEAAGQLMVVDCGVNFPGPQEPGIDWLLPEFTFLRARRRDLCGIVLTHGHEDHIGALPWLLGDLQTATVPVYGTPFTLALVNKKLAEHDDLGANLQPIEDGRRIHMGPFDVEPIAVTHSIPGSVALAINTAAGCVIHTGDFKLDPSPSDGRRTDEERLSVLGDEGVLALFSDSTNAGRPGHTRSEGEVAKTLALLIGQATGRVIVTTFSSNVFRLRAIIDAAIAANRYVIATGRSVVSMIQMCRENGFLEVPHGVLRNDEDLENLAANRVVVIAAGCQGEAHSAFGRIATGTHSRVRVEAGDLVILSSRRIPGNERAIGAAINHLLRMGAQVVDDRHHDVHTSGHAFADELRHMIELCRPRYFIPVHGELRHIIDHGRLAESTGLGREHIFIMEDGQTLELDPTRAQLGETVPAGHTYLEGGTSTGLGDIILRDRQILSLYGFAACVAILRPDGSLAAPVKIITRGVVHVDDNPEIIAEAAAAVEQAIITLSPDAEHDDRLEAARLALRRYFRRTLNRRPLLLPTIIEA